MSVMRLRGLVLFVWFLPGVARRSIRGGHSQYGAQQQIDTFTRTLELSADVRERLFQRDLRQRAVARADEPVDVAMVAEALDGMNRLLAVVTESPTKLQWWLQISGPVQDLARERPEVATLLTDEDQLGSELEVLKGVKRLVVQQRELLRKPKAAMAVVAEATDVLEKAADLVRRVEGATKEPDLKKARQEGRQKAPESAEPLGPLGRTGFAPKAKARFFQVPAAARASTRRFARRVAHDPVMESQAELELLAKELNPAIGYWDPLNLAQGDFWEQGDEATVGFLRHAEIKHGRVAMAAFVGYVLQSNGVHFPGNLAVGVSYDSIAAAGGPADQWDALPFGAKMQIIWFVGFLEFVSEAGQNLPSAPAHYMRGGKPGAFPSLKEAAFQFFPHPVPFDLFDPFSFQKGKSDEWKAQKLRAEINNGRLAMLGIMAFLAESKIPGAVPILNRIGTIKPYVGEYMAPFVDGELPMIPLERLLPPGQS